MPQLKIPHAATKTQRSQKKKVILGDKQISLNKIQLQSLDPLIQLLSISHGEAHIKVAPFGTQATEALLLLAAVPSPGLLCPSRM